MKVETLDTMIRHFKGIIAALEKEKVGRFYIQKDGTIPESEVHFVGDRRLKGKIINTK